MENQTVFHKWTHELSKEACIVSITCARYIIDTSCMSITGPWTWKREDSSKVYSWMQSKFWMVPSVFKWQAGPAQSLWTHVIPTFTGAWRLRHLHMSLPEADSLLHRELASLADFPDSLDLSMAKRHAAHLDIGSNRPFLGLQVCRR